MLEMDLSDSSPVDSQLLEIPYQEIFAPLFAESEAALLEEWNSRGRSQFTNPRFLSKILRQTNQDVTNYLMGAPQFPEEQSCMRWHRIRHAGLGLAGVYLPLQLADQPLPRVLIGVGLLSLTAFSYLHVGCLAPPVPCITLISGPSFAYSIALRPPQPGAHVMKFPELPVAQYKHEWSAPAGFEFFSFSRLDSTAVSVPLCLILRPQDPAEFFPFARGGQGQDG